MREVEHLESLEPCPLLPGVEIPQTAAAMRRFGADRGIGFYVGALSCAQSLWLQGLPAQALLQLNRAFGADLSGLEPQLKIWPLPYSAVAWILERRRVDRFMGDPRRHFQHLATRMVEPRKEVRTWRAWGCWDLARRIHPEDPADEVQIAQEGVIEPETGQILAELKRVGLPGESEVWWEVIRERFPPVGRGSEA